MKCLVAVFLLGMSCFASAFEMVKSGKANAAIVMPKEVSPALQTACDELNYHIRQSTGVTLPVIREGEKSEYENLILLGNTLAAAEQGLKPETLGGNAYRLQINGNKFFICGNDRVPEFGFQPRGTLFGVYDFLENGLGVRWLWPGKVGEYIPKRKDIFVNEIKATPPAIKNIRWYITYRKVRSDPGRSMVTEKFIDEEMVFLRRQRVAMENDYQTSHSFIYYWKLFHESHPEIFQLLPNGKRGLLSQTTDPKYVGMCVAQPKLWDIVIEQWKKKCSPNYKEWISNRDEIIFAGENDTPGFCVCRLCRAWDSADSRFKTDPYWSKGIIRSFDRRFQAMADEAGELDDIPSLSDRYARFYLKILELGKKINPRMKVAGFAYANYLAPPADVKLNPDIVITYTPALFYPWTDQNRQRFRDNFRGWGRTGAGASLVYRPNYTHSGHNMPLLYGHHAAEDIKFAFDNGALQAAFDCLKGQWGTQAMNFYWIQRTAVYPERSPDDLLREFAGAFGDAAKATEDYLRYWQKVADGFSSEKFAEYRVLDAGGGFQNWLRVADRIFTPEIMDKASRLLDTAAEKAKNDPDALDKVKFLQDGLRHADLTIIARRAWRAYKKDGNEYNRAEFIKSLQALHEYRKQLMSTNSSNIDYLLYREPATWDPSFRDMPVVLVELPTLWAFKRDKARQGENEKWFTGKEFSNWDKVETGKYGHDVSSSKAGEKEMGWEWYALKFKTPDFAEDRQVNIFFGAVDEDCDIWVNSKHVLSRIYGANTNPDSREEPFSIDITEQLNKVGDENTLVVKIAGRGRAGNILKPVSLAPGVALSSKNLLPNPGFEE